MSAKLCLSDWLADCLIVSPLGKIFARVYVCVRVCVCVAKSFYYSAKNRLNAESRENEIVCWFQRTPIEDKSLPSDGFRLFVIEIEIKLKPASKKTK